MLTRKKHISLFFLTVFAFIKLVGLHEFTHSENELFEDCEVCEYIVTSNKIPFITSEQTVCKQQFIQHNFNKKVAYNYSYQFTKTLIDKRFYGRPPPTV